MQPHHHTFAIFFICSVLFWGGNLATWSGCFCRRAPLSPLLELTDSLLREHWRHYIAMVVCSISVVSWTLGISTLIRFDIQLSLSLSCLFASRTHHPHHSLMTILSGSLLSLALPWITFAATKVLLYNTAEIYITYVCVGMSDAVE